MTAFEAHMHALAKDFIGTVLFVDDQFDDQSIPTSTSSETTAGTNQQADNPLENAAIDAGELQEPVDSSAPVKNRDDSHILKIKELSQAFSANDILYSPIYTEPISSKELQDIFVAKVCRLANKADVIVLDWQMEAAASAVEIGTTAQRIIAKYKSDNPDRDILVCIFTAEPENKIGIKLLSKDNVKVFYVSKRETGNYERLPEMIFREFAKRHEGLLPAAALTAIKVIRSNTHRLLRKYSPDKDAAYLSHRCLVENVNDAEFFVTELLAASFGDLVKGNEKIINTVCENTLRDWLDSRKDYFINDKFTIAGLLNKKITNAIRNEWIKKGISNWVKGECKNRKRPKDIKQKLKKWETNHSLSLAKFFTNKTDAKDLISMEACFSRFASHVFFDDAEKNVSTTFITLGSLLKKNNSNKYYLCIQPVCDSVRLEAKKSKFLFLSLESCEISDESRAGFHIVVDDNKDVFLKVCESTSRLTVFEFSAEKPSGKVLSKANSIIKGFENSTQVEFKMLAQLRSEHAHRIATKFMHNITRVGLDEPEWLRRHSTV